MSALGRRGRLVLFAVIAGCCLVGAVGYGLLAQDRYRDRMARAPTVRHTEASSYAGEARIVFRNTSTGSAFGLVAQVPVADPGAPRALSTVACDRIDATDTGASCLRSRRGVVTRYDWLDLGPDLAERATRPLSGIPSRTRLSDDGRLVASTVFVTGHSYMQVGFSTATVVREVGGRSHGNLERFALLVHGRRVLAEDRNVWGVTFTDDDRTFYATAATGGTAYLVRGDLRARTLTAVRPGAECPSLSPDGTQVAYKVARAGGGAPQWGLAVLDLRTGRERRLVAERRNVDDQAEWLDDDTLLYGLARPDEPGVTDVWSLRTDGSAPRRLIDHAWSPAVVR